MELKKRILISIAGITALLVLLFVSSFYLMAKLNSVIMEREANDIPTEAVMDFRYHVAQVQQFYTDAGATGDADSIDEAAKHYAEGVKRLDLIEQNALGEAGAVAQIKQRFADFNEVGKRMAEAYISGGRAAGNPIMKEAGTGFDARAEALVQALTPLADRLEAKNAELKHAVVRDERRDQWVLLIGELLVLAGVVGALVPLGRGVLNQIGGEPAYAAEVAARIARGDLVTPVIADKNGSLLMAMRKMQVDLRETIAQIRQSAEALASASYELSSGAEKVSDGSRSQSESASAMAAAVEEMTVSVSHVADNSAEAREAARHSGMLAEQGGLVVDSAVKEMGKIAGSVNESARIISELESQSNQIAEVINVIQEIADQTNLLALNAAIEAARAGEQGRGFAVVADEVRKLAERTSQSTQEISAMIDNIQSGTRNAVDSMRKGVEMANEGTSMANKAGETIASLKADASHSASIVSDISNAIKEQSATTQEIARNVEQIAQMAESNSVEAEQSAASARNLYDLSNGLNELVGRFRIS